MSTIALDMMGGDYAPQEAVKGVSQYISHHTNPAHLLLLGEEKVLTSLLQNEDIPADSFTLINCTQEIQMHEHPTRALKEKKDSSIFKGFEALTNNDAQAFISAGNTGAMMVGALHSIKTISGIHRPAIGAYIPREDDSLGLLIDVGLNADSKPENLLQFAMLGSLFAQHILGVTDPKTGLVNIGEEEGKGNILSQGAHTLLKTSEHINFIGNIEGRDILSNRSDIMVCDGFTGNVVLKLAESLYDLSRRRNIDDPFFEKFNFEVYGGVPVLGVAKPVIIGHGISGAKSFTNMIHTAEKMLTTDLCGLIEKAFQK